LIYQAGQVLPTAKQTKLQLHRLTTPVGITGSASQERNNQQAILQEPLLDEAATRVDQKAAFVGKERKQRQHVFEHEDSLSRSVVICEQLVADISATVLSIFDVFVGSQRSPRRKLRRSLSRIFFSWTNISFSPLQRLGAC